MTRHGRHGSERAEREARLEAPRTRTLLVGTLAGLCFAAPGHAQVVVSFVGEDLVITHLDTGAVKQVPLGAGVLAVAANARHGYALLAPGTQVVRVDREREEVRPGVPVRVAMVGRQLVIASGDETNPAPGEFSPGIVETRDSADGLSVVGSFRVRGTPILAGVTEARGFVYLPDTGDDPSLGSTDGGCALSPASPGSWLVPVLVFLALRACRVKEAAKR